MSHQYGLNSCLDLPRKKVFWVSKWAVFIFWAFFQHVAFANSDSLSKELETVPTEKKFHLSIELIQHYSLEGKDSIAIAQLEELRSDWESFTFLEQVTIENAEGIVYRRIGNYTRAIQSLLKAKSTLQEEAIPADLKIEVLNNLGVAFRRIDKHEDALKNHIEALQLAKEHGNEKGEQIAMNGIGNIHFFLEDYETSLRYFREGLKREQQIDNKRGVAINMNNIGGVYLALDQLDSALHYNRASLEINEELNNQYGKNICLNAIGNIYQKQKDYDSALNYYIKAVETPTSDLRMQLETQLNIGEIYGILGLEEQAYNMIQVALYNATFNNQLTVALRGNELLFDYYLRNNDVQGAKSAHDKVLRLKDRIVNQNAQRDLQLMSAKHDAAEKQQTIVQLKEEKQNQIFLFSLIGSIILIAVLLGIVIYVSRQNQQKAKANLVLAKTVEEKDVLISELHHRVKNNLAVISGILQLQALKSKSEEAQTILTEGQHRIKVISLVYEILYNDDVFAQCNMKSFTQLLIEYVEGSLLRSESVTIDSQVETIALEPNNAIPCAVILYELVSFSMQNKRPHQENLHIQISISQSTSKEVLIQVASNGQELQHGFNLKNIDTLGFSLIQLYTKQIKGKLAAVKVPHFSAAIEVVFSPQKMKTWK